MEIEIRGNKLAQIYLKMTKKIMDVCVCATVSESGWRDICCIL